MKKLIIVIAIILPSLIYSQFKIDTLKAEGSFSKVYEVQTSKSQLHQKANEWLAINFKDANEVIKLNTEDKIITKGFFNINILSSGYNIEQKVYFITEVAFKENRYKLDCHSFKLSTTFNGTTIEVPYNDYLCSLNYDNYVAFLKTQTEVNNSGGALSDKRVRKVYSKILEDPAKIKEYFEKSQPFEKQVTAKVTAQIKTLATNLFNYINKESAEDW